MEIFSDACSRIAGGDREAMAAFVMQLRSRILRRVRGKIKRAGMQLVDEEDVFSSLARRLDVLCKDGRVVSIHDKQLTAFILKIAMNLTIDKVRAERTRERTLRQLWGDLRCAASGRPDQQNERALRWLLKKLSPKAREMIEMRLRGTPHRAIAAHVGLSIGEYRSQWRRARLQAKSRVRMARPSAKFPAVSPAA